MTTSKKHFSKQLATVFFASLGCPKNTVDSQVMAGRLIDDGLELVGDPAKADVIVVNTCSFIGDARTESVDTILEMASYKKQGRCKLLVAAGCLPQQSGPALMAAMPEIDTMVGTGELARIGDIVRGAVPGTPGGRPGHYLQQKGDPRFIEAGAKSAYVKISDGCSRSCAFCAIPGIKGKLRSRPEEEIVAEVRALAQQGVIEVNLVAQDSGAYGRDLGKEGLLAHLLEVLNDVDGLVWIRVLYLYPDTVTETLLQVMADCDKVVPYLDIPIQHGSANMLRTMKRGHRLPALHKILKQAKRTLPQAFLRTTVLIGHPGETAQDIDELIKLMNEVRFDHLGSFRYSDEENTAAFYMADKVSRRDSYNRWRKVMAAQRRIVKEKNRALLGQKIQVLVEDVADESGFVLVGRHAGQAPEIDGVTYLTSVTANIGDLVDAVVTDVKLFDLVATAEDLPK